MAEPTVIAHISDLHCGSRYHIPSLAKRVIDELNLLCPDIVIVTGDLTDMGFKHEFEAAPGLPEAPDGMGFEDALRHLVGYVVADLSDPRWQSMLPALLMLKHHESGIAEVEESLNRRQLVATV